MSVFAVTNACAGCGNCLRTCPEKAIRPSGAPYPAPPLVVLEDRCSGCAECAEVCPVSACVEVRSSTERSVVERSSKERSSKERS